MRQTGRENTGRETSGKSRRPPLSHGAGDGAFGANFMVNPQSSSRIQQSTKIWLGNTALEIDRLVQRWRGPHSDLKSIGLPPAYITSLLTHLRADPRIEFITYDDLAWQSDDGNTGKYRNESARWRSRFGRSDKIYVLLQHDCDSGPTASVSMLELEQSLGIRSTLMVYNRWRHPKSKDVVRYPIDFEAVTRLASQGFCVGYHANVVQTCTDESEVYKAFSEDIAELRRLMPIRYFSAHGGSQTLNGKGNNAFDYTRVCPDAPRWVHNGSNPRFDGTYNDGALVRRINQNDRSTDFRRFLTTMLPGRRYRIHLHPQNYFHTVVNAERFRAAYSGPMEWVKQALSAQETARYDGYWPPLPR
jgi:hypothetical protein